MTDGQLCPWDLKCSLRRYADHHVRCGDFLRSVLAGDLYGAVTRADMNNIRLLVHITSFVLNEMPEDAIGSYARVEAWERGIR